MFWICIGFIFGAVGGFITGALVYRNNAKKFERKYEFYKAEAENLKKDINEFMGKR